MKNLKLSYNLRLWGALLCLLVAAINAQGTDVTSTFIDADWSVTSGEATWSASTITVQGKETRGVQVTLSNIKSAGGFTLTNTSIKDISGLNKVTGVSLNVSSNGTGGSIASVTVNGTTFKNGENTSYAVTKDDGQNPSFTHATGDKGDIVISFSSTATSKSLYIKSITVTYTTSEGGDESTTYTVDYSDTDGIGSNGSYSASPTSAAENATITLTAVPVNGYQLSSWTVTKEGGGTITTTSTGTNTATFSMPAENVTVSATFTPKGCSDHAGTNVTSGTSTAYEYGPVDPYYKYSTRQIFYTKTDLGLAAGKKGVINSIYFEYAYSSAMTSKTDVTIYMVNTNLTALSTSNYVTVTNENIVYSGALNCTNGWNEIELTTPFSYNGTGNLVVVIDDNSDAYDGSSYVFKYHTADPEPTYAQLYVHSDSDNKDPQAAATWTSASTTNYRPNTKFCIEEQDLAKCTVTFNAGSGTCGTASLEEATAGAGVTLPTATHSCAGWTFAGWATASEASETTTKPTLYTAGDTYYPASNLTLYAVYQRTEGDAPKTYTLTINTSNIGSGYTGSWGTNTDDTIRATATDASTYAVKIGHTDCGSQSSNFQFKKSTGCFWNTNDLGTINSVTINSGTSIDYYIGTSEKPSSKGSGGYFKVYNTTSNAQTITSVVISFTKGIGTTYYHSTPSCTGLQVTPTSLDFGTKNISTNTDLTITVTGTELTADASLSISGTDAGMFSVTPASLAKNGSGEITGSDNVTVSYSPTAEGTHSATLTITSGSFTKTVTLTGTCALVCTTPTLAFTGNVTSKEALLSDGSFTLAASATGNTLGAAITYSSSNTAKAEVSSSGVVTLKQATGSGSPVTITATLAAASTGVACQNEVTASYTLTIYNKVRWLVNGEEYTTGSPTTQTTQGGQIATFPDDPDGSSVCGGKEFMGWTTEANKNWSSDAAPSPLYTSIDDMSSVYITANTNYYAVFATVSGESETVYQKGTSSDLTNGKRVLIVNHSSSKALSSETSSYDLASEDVTISAGNITTSNTAIVWYVTAGFDGKKFYQGGNYLNAIEDGSYHNLHANTTEDEWKITDGSTSGTYILESTNLDDYYIEYYNSKFTVYTGGSGAAYEIDFYVPAAGHSAYATSCCDEVASPTITVDPRSNKATFDWNSQIGATNGYSLVVKEGGTTVFEKTDIAAGVTSWEVTSLSSSTTYNYTLTAKGATCSAVAMGSFTTTSCEDVPYDIYVAPGVKTATIRWKADESTTATIRFYSDAECETELTAKAIVGATSPCNVTGLDENTQYYVKIFAGGTCASSAVSLLTQTTAVEIAEWFTDSIRITLNDIDASASVLIEDKKESGNKTSNVATKLFFSKYYEAYLSVKLWAIYNGTKEKISLANVVVKSANNGNYWGKDNTTGTGADNAAKVTSFASYGHYETGYIYPGEEIIVYTPGPTDGSTNDHKIIECMEDSFGTAYKTDPDSLWYQKANQTTNISGDDGLLLLDGTDTLDVIGGINTATAYKKISKPSWGDAKGWSCDDGEDAEGNPLALSTNRCLLVRKNTVHSGDSAVKYNRDNFTTLCSEWWGAHVPVTSDEVKISCENFSYVGHYDYEKYYASFDSVTTVSEIGSKRNDDGTYTVPIPLLDTLSCTMLRVKVYEGEVEKASREYKVPIMVEGNKSTNDTIFINTKAPIRTEKICNDCDVVILRGGTLTKAKDGTGNDMDSVRNLTIYPGGKLIIPKDNGSDKYTYNVNSIQFRVQGEEVSIAQLQGQLNTKDKQVIVSRRIKNDRYYFFSLPYDCNISDIRWSNGETPVRGTDYQIVEYDAVARAAQGSTKGAPGHWKPVTGAQLKAGVGYNIAVSDQYLKELVFPMAIGQTNLTDKEDNKTTNTVTLTQNTGPTSRNNHNWNLVAHPYVSPFEVYSDAKITAGWLKCTFINDRTDTIWSRENTSNVYITMPSFKAGYINYEQTLATDITSLDPFLAVFVQASSEGDLTFSQSNRKLSAPARHLAAKTEDEDESIFVGVTLSGNGENDHTSVRIRPDFTDEYQLGYDLQKFTTYNTPKPQIYMKPSDLQLAFQAVSDSVAKNTWMPMGVYLRDAGTYTFALKNNYPIDEVAAVYLNDKVAGVTTNLLYDSYTITTDKQLYTNKRFELQVILNRRVKEIATDTQETITDNPEGVLRKILINDHVYIQRGERIYDITGKQVR